MFIIDQDEIKLDWAQIVLSQFNACARDKVYGWKKYKILYFKTFSTMNILKDMVKILNIEYGQKNIMDCIIHASPG